MMMSMIMMMMMIMMLMIKMMMMIMIAYQSIIESINQVLTNTEVIFRCMNYNGDQDTQALLLLNSTYDFFRQFRHELLTLSTESEDNFYCVVAYSIFSMW
jgi:hypothetical protein